MFEVKDNILKWEDSQYEIPEELHGKQIVDIFGTATAGLARMPGIFMRVRDGSSVEVLIEDGAILSCRLVGDIPERGTLVYLREQMAPISGTSLWLASTKEIKNEINWLNVQFDDGSTWVLCPFTMDYGIK